ncbi:5495_t:CDS:2, partial [Cetraspora pellucida]
MPTPKKSELLTNKTDEETAADHYFLEDMHADLEDLAKNRELTFEEIPSVKLLKVGLE